MSSLTPSSVSGPGGTHYRRYSSVQRRNRVRRGEKKTAKRAFLRLRCFFTDTLFQSPVACHKLRHLLYPLKREGRRAYRLHCNAHQLHGVIVRGYPVGAQCSAAAAAVYDRPLAVFPYPDGNRLHDPSAAALPVAGFDIDVKAAKTVRAVIAVIRPGIFRGDRPTAYLTGKAVSARVCFIVSFFKCSPLVFTVHGVVLLNDIFYISAGRFGSCSA